MKNILIYMMCMIAGVPAFAQDYTKHEFVVRGAAGVNSLFFDTKGVTNEVGFGGNAGVGYNYFFNRNWGFGTGVEVGFYNAKATTDKLYGEYKAYDRSVPESFMFRYNAENFEEEQAATMLTIPLMAVFQKGNKHVFYGSAGLRISIPLSATFDQESSELTTTGFYPTLGYPVANVPEAGFVEIPQYQSSGDIDLKTSCMLSIEAGMKWKLQESWSLYTGLYIDYGLNNIQKTSDKETVQYQLNQPASLGSNSLLNSSATDKIHAISCGIRVGVAFGKAAK